MYMLIVALIDMHACHSPQILSFYRRTSQGCNCINIDTRWNTKRQLTIIPFWCTPSTTCYMKYVHVCMECSMVYVSNHSGRNCGKFSSPYYKVLGSFIPQKGDKNGLVLGFIRFGKFLRMLNTLWFNNK